MQVRHLSDWRVQEAGAVSFSGDCSCVSPQAVVQRRVFFIFQSGRAQVKSYEKSSPFGELSDEVEVELAAYPGIGGGVFHLLWREFTVLPVGALCTFTDAEAQKIGRKRTQALRLYALGACKRSEIHDAAGREVVQAAQPAFALPKTD